MWGWYFLNRTSCFHVWLLSFTPGISVLWYETLEIGPSCIIVHESFRFVHRCLILMEATEEVIWIPNYLPIFDRWLFFLHLSLPLFSCISCEAFVEKSTFEHMLNPKIFVCHSAVLRDSSWSRSCKYSCVLLLLHITYDIHWTKYV